MQTIRGRGTGVAKEPRLFQTPGLLFSVFYWFNEHVGKKGGRIFYAGNHPP